MRMARLTAVVKGAIRRTQALSRTARPMGLRRPSLKSCQWVASAGVVAILGLSTGILPPASAVVPILRPDASQTRRAQVLQVLDLTTLAVRFDNDVQVRQVQMIGLAGIPPINPTWTESTGQTPMAVYLAAQYLQDLVAGEWIELEFDPRLGTTGSPLAAYVWKANVFVNREMLLRGHALFAPVDVPTKYGAALEEAAAVARGQGRGVWSFFGPQPGQANPPAPPAQDPESPFEVPLDTIGSAAHLLNL